MNYKIKSTSILELELVDGTSFSKHIDTLVGLELDYNLRREAYFEENSNRLAKDGCIAVTQCFVQGLIANIHMAHEFGYIDSAAHLRQIIADLEKGFIAIAKIEVIEQ